VALLSITLMVGAVTPPVASFLVISPAIAKTTLTESSRAMWPFLGDQSVVILLGVLYPRRMLFLPRFRMGWGWLPRRVDIAPPQ